MDIYKYLRKKLGVPDNWGKYDYETQRYSFDDIAEILHDVVNNKCNLPVVRFSEAEVCRCRNKECLRHKGGICMTAGFTCVDRQT